MKKVLILLVTVVAFGFAANAQNAIGVRLGGGTAYGATSGATNSVPPTLVGSLVVA